MSSKWRRKGENIPTDNATWSRWKLGSNINSQNGIAFFQSTYYQTESQDVFWACKIYESFPPQNGCAPRAWTTEVGFQSQIKGIATISIIIYYSDHPGFIGPCEELPPASIPNLIRRLCEDTQVQRLVDSYDLMLQPIHLIPGDFSQFWDVVSNPERSVPVIYISPPQEG